MSDSHKMKNKFEDCDFALLWAVPFGSQVHYKSYELKIHNWQTVFILMLFVCLCDIIQYIVFPFRFAGEGDQCEGRQVQGLTAGHLLIPQ